MKKESFVPQKERDVKRFFLKKEKSGLRRCPGHWINKKMGLAYRDCYEDNGQCRKCGGWKK